MSATAPPTGSARSSRLPTVAPDELARLAALVPAGDDAPALPVEAPFTGEVVGTVPACTAADVAAAVERARVAQRVWARRPVAQRARVVRRFRSLLLDRREALCDLIGLEAGKPRYHAFVEVYNVAENCRFYARHAADYLAEDRRAGPVPLLTAVRVRRRPIGVVGVVSPWNYPLMLSVGDAIPALLAGNAVVLKPAEETPFAALAALDLLREAGLPADALQVLTGFGDEAGAALADAADFVGFTGSAETGRIVGERAGRRLRDCSLELGGKNPMVVLDDADLDRAVEGAVQGAFGNAGQVCLAPERIYVEESAYDPFLQAFAGRTRRLRMDASADYAVEVGSLISADHLAKVAAHVGDAVDRGATVVAGGRARPDVGPYFYEPTVLVGVEPGMRVHDEETFGPVVSVYRVADAAEAVARANDTSSGLSASVWTADRRRGARVARALSFGTVTINGPYAVGYAATAAPMGGLRDSGIGRRHGPEGFLKYTATQTVARNRGAELLPPGRRAKRVVRRMSRLAGLLGRLPRLR